MRSTTMLQNTTQRIQGQHLSSHQILKRVVGIPLTYYPKPRIGGSKTLIGHIFKLGSRRSLTPILSKYSQISEKERVDLTSEWQDLTFDKMY